MGRAVKAKHKPDLRANKPGKAPKSVAADPSATTPDDQPVIALHLKPGKLSPAMTAYFRKCQDKLGFIPNVLVAYAFDTVKLEAFVAMYNDLMLGESGLSKLEREILLLALTGFMGLMLGPILQVALGLSNGAQIVAMAAGGTGAIFLVLAGIPTTSKRDFSFMGKFLLVGIVLLILASLANLFFQIPALALTLSAVAVLLFSGFILYEVSRVVNGGETNYVMATLAIYLDIYNLFVNLLQLLMAFMGERE